MESALDITGAGLVGIQEGTKNSRADHAEERDKEGHDRQLRFVANVGTIEVYGTAGASAKIGLPHKRLNNVSDFHFTLLENGLDFVLSSLEHLAAASPTPTFSPRKRATPSAFGQKRHLKYALIHLCSGIELVFKERLRQENWQLVFSDMAKADEKAYESGDFQSVNFKDAQTRLEKECGVPLTPTQKSDLEQFRKLRNKVEHFGALDSLIAVQSMVSQMVSFVLDFIEEAFEEDDLDAESDLLIDIREKLGDCNAIIQERWKVIDADVQERYSVIRCPKCRQEAMSADGGTVKCLFCNYGVEPEKAATEYVSNILGYGNRYIAEKDGDEWPVEHCPDCGSYTFVTEVPGAHDVQGSYCFNCGQDYQGGQLERCYYCGQLHDYHYSPGMTICSECFQAKVDKDD